MMRNSQKVLSTLVMLILVFGIGSGTAADAGVTVPVYGTDCYIVNEVYYPAVFGEPELTDEEIASLAASADPDTAASAIHTVPDCLLYLKACKLSEGKDADAEAVLKNRSGSPEGFCEAMLFLLAGDCEESGFIKLRGDEDFYELAYVSLSGIYYPFDVFSAVQRYSPWMNGYPKGSYEAQSPEELAQEILSHDRDSRHTEAESVVFINHRNTDLELRVKQLLETGEYSNEQIRQLAASHLSLEEAAEKIHTPNDAVRFLKASGFEFGYSYCHNKQINRIGWAWGLSAEFVYEHMRGSCSGISSLMNRLLTGDYEEQGYVIFDGAHVFNYFRQDGVYCFCDFTPCLSEDGSRYTSDGNYEAYVIDAFENPRDFGEFYYLSVFPKAWNDPSDENYLYFMYLYPLDGRNVLASGTNSYPQHGNVIPSEIQNSLIELYIRDGYHLTFYDFDSDAYRPEEVNIPWD